MFKKINIIIEKQTKKINEQELKRKEAYTKYMIKKFNEIIDTGNGYIYKKDDEICIKIYHKSGDIYESGYETDFINYLKDNGAIYVNFEYTKYDERYSFSSIKFKEKLSKERPPNYFD